jgi:hypothetical protein
MSHGETFSLKNLLLLTLLVATLSSSEVASDDRACQQSAEATIAGYLDGRNLRNKAEWISALLVSQEEANPGVCS